MTDNVNWSNFAGFKNLNRTNLESAFGDSVGGAAFAVGRHTDVAIESIEPKHSKAGNPYLAVVFNNEAGAQIRKAVMLTDNKGEPGYSYRQLAAALMNDRELRMETFSGLFLDNPALLDSIRGLKLSINVELGKKGYLINKSAIGDGYVLVDVVTDKEFPDFEGMIFEGYDEAKAAAKEAGIYRCYNEVTGLLKGSKDVIATNEEVLRKIVSTGGAGVTGIAKAPSAAKRPAV